MTDLSDETKDGSEASAPPDRIAVPEGTRVVLAIKYLDERWGGAERMVCLTANVLVELGYQVAISVWEPNGPRVMFDLHPSVHVTNARMGNIKIAAAVPDAMSSVETLAGTDAAIAAEFQDWVKGNRFSAEWASSILALGPSLVIAYLPHTYMPLLFALGRTVPVIASFESDPSLELQRFLGDRDTGAKRALYWQILGMAAGIKTLLPPFVEEIALSFSGRIFLVPNCIAPKEIHALATDQQRLFAAGRLTEVKGFRILLDAMKIVTQRYPDCRLTLYGDGELREDLERQIANLSLNDNVALCGFVPKLDMPMAESRIAVVPSTIEGFSLVALEAMAAGLPIVAFRDCRAVAYLVEDGDAGIVVQTRAPESLAAAIMVLLDAPALTRARGEAGRLYARGYSREFYKEKVQRMVTDVLTNHL